MNLCTVFVVCDVVVKQFAIFPIFVQKKQSTLKLDIVFIVSRNQN